MSLVFKQIHDTIILKKRWTLLHNVTDNADDVSDTAA